MRSNGSIIGAQNPPTKTSAKGVWDLRTQHTARLGNDWETPVPGFGNASRDFNAGSMRTEKRVIAGEAFSLTFWAKHPTTPGQWSVLVGTEYNTTTPLIYFDTDSFKFLCGGATVYKAVATPTNWNHYALTFAGGAGGAVICYVNADIGTSSTGTVADTEHPRIAIGASNVNAYQSNAKISDVRFYNAVLDADDLTDLMAGTHISTNLTNWWCYDADTTNDYFGDVSTNHGSTYSTDGPLD